MTPGFGSQFVRGGRVSEAQGVREQIHAQAIARGKTAFTRSFLNRTPPQSRHDRFAVIGSCLLLG